MEVIHAANVAVDIVVGSVRNLGLEVVFQKTKAIFVYERRTVGAIASSRSPGGDYNGANGAPDEISGAHLQRPLGAHFERLASRLGRLADALAGIMPNLRPWCGSAAGMRPSGVPLWGAGLGQRDGARRPDSSMYKSDAALPRPSNIKGIQDDVACRRDESSRMFLPRISWDNNYR